MSADGARAGGDIKVLVRASRSPKSIGSLRH